MGENVYNLQEATWGASLEEMTASLRLPGAEIILHHLCIYVYITIDRPYG